MATKVRKTVEKGRVYVTATFNNTIVTITDESGNTLCWGSSGAVGFKGAREATRMRCCYAVLMSVLANMELKAEGASRRTASNCGKSKRRKECMVFWNAN